jgi:hypothetical protein
MSPAPPVEPEGSFSVALSGILLIIIGLLVGLVGVIFLVVGAAAKSFIDTAIANSNTTAADTTGLANFVEGILAALGIIIGLYGLGELISGIGILAKRQWARILGLMLALIAGVLTTLVLLGGLSGASTRTVPVGFSVVTLIFALVYWFIVVALARGGRAFHHG